MKTFEEAWKFSDKIPGSFTTLSGKKLFEYACKVPTDGIIAEIGVDQGRSLSVMLQSRDEENPATFLVVDSWESVLRDNMVKVQALLEKFGPPNHLLLNMTSVAAADIWSGAIDMIHIDAHHYDDTDKGGPTLDCEHWLPKLKSGGVACFHDYDSTFKDVKKAVDLACKGWFNLGNYDSLAIRRKP
jgi:hypothetical protein